MVYIIAWRGLACVAYPCLGAMRRPEVRDGREVRISHAFFVSIILKLNRPKLGERVGRKSKWNEKVFVIIDVSHTLRHDSLGCDA